MTSDLFMRSVRAVLKLTQEQLADALDISRFTIGRYENGEPMPAVTKLALLHLLQQHKIDPDVVYACAHLPSKRHKLPRNRRKLMAKIRTEAALIRAGKR